MRYSIVFFAALLGSTAATQASELQDREVQDVAASALLERTPVMRPPGWKGAGMLPKIPSGPKRRPSRPKRLRNLEELEERDLFEDSFSTLQERAPFMRPPGWKGAGIPPKMPSGPKRRPSRPKRLRNLEELEERAPVMRPPGWKGIGMPSYKKPFIFPKGRPTGRNRQRDLEELEAKDLQRRALPGSMPRRMGLSGSPIHRPYKGLAAPRRRPRDVEELDERDLYDDAWFDPEE
ncbi:unnamed protein product [Clonostachys solani]|uniref:Uncharacterized protein n=1 Tax=Clonostachys solani TaxID=160281 RepID=A0A9N9YU36_9HYPO|nr:unnamed protein product [Clonostachys solani]